MKRKAYEGKTKAEIEKMLAEAPLSRRTKYRIAKETGITIPGKRRRAVEKESPFVYEVSKGPWV